MSKKLSLEAFSKVVEAIYDSAVDAQRWRQRTGPPVTAPVPIDIREFVNSLA